MFAREAAALQQAVSDAIRGAAEDMQRSFVGVPEVVKKILSLIVRHSKCDWSDRPRFSSA